MKQLQSRCFWLFTLLLLTFSNHQLHAAFPIHRVRSATDSIPYRETSLPAAVQQEQHTGKLERWALKVHHKSKAYRQAAVNGFAIGALAGVGVGLLGFVFIEGWILGLGAVAAITLGIIGVSGHRKNKWLAWLAIILGSIELLFLIAVLLVIASL